MNNDFVIITTAEALNNYFCVMTGSPYTKDNANDTQVIEWHRITDKGSEKVDKINFSLDCDCDGPQLPYKEKHPKKAFDVGVKRPSIKLIINPALPAGIFIKHLQLTMKAAFVYGINEMAKVLPQVLTLEYKEIPGDGALIETCYEAIAVTRDLKRVPFYDITSKLQPAELVKLKVAFANNLTNDTINKRVTFKDFDFKLCGKNKLCYIDGFLTHATYPKVGEGAQAREVRNYRKNDVEPLPCMQEIETWGIRIPRLGLLPNGGWAPIKNSNWATEPNSGCKPVLSSTSHCDFAGRVLFSVTKVSQPDDKIKTNIKLEYRCMVSKFPHPSTMKRGGTFGGVEEIEDEFEVDVKPVPIGSALGVSSPASSGNGTVLGEE